MCNWVYKYTRMYICIYVYSLLLDLNFEIYFVEFRIWGFFLSDLSRKFMINYTLLFFVILLAKACRKRNSAQLLSNSVFPNSAPFRQNIYITVAVNVNSEFRNYVYEKLLEMFL